jgi:hypothetical protein
MSPAQCRSCDALIQWAETLDGNFMPLDLDATPTGTLVVINGKVRLATDDDRRLRRPLYVSHFATCPQAAKWRRQ